MKYQILLNLTQLPERLVLVNADGTAAPAGYTKIGTFDHADEDDKLGWPGSHVLYHHVRDALYFVKEGGVPAIGFWPDNITDMQTVTIKTAP